MTFRRRLALLVAAAVVIVGAAVVGSVYLVVRAQLRDQVETELHELAEVVRAASASGSLPVPRGAQAPSPPNVPRIVDADGTVVQSRMPGLMLPVTAEAQAVAAGTRESSLETLRLGPDRYAVVTLPLGSSRAVQIARSLAPVDDLLSRLLRMSLATGGAVVVLAPFIGYVVAGGGLVPVRRLSRTAEGVAKTGDLRQRADVHGNDELASLASSFNAMLDRLEAMVDTLERAQRAQRQLVADASHELRTPLATLRANVEFLTLGSAGSGTDRSEVATDTLAQIDDLTALVGQLIDLAREDERRPEQTPVRLDHVVDNALERARQHHPAVSFAVDLEHTTVLGAEDALSRAVANLLDNAGNWSPAGATVKVRLHGGVLEVRDQGPGIDPTDLPYVFDRFYRGAGTRRAVESPRRRCVKKVSQPPTARRPVVASPVYCWCQRWYPTNMSTKTTVYLTAELKAGVEREARRQGLSEAEVIRRAIAATVRAPRPRAGVIDGEPFADRVDELLDGFGRR